MSKELAKTYDPKGIEDRIYDKWLAKKYFHAEVDHSKTPFTIVIPPPNITGQLHMGHALDNTMQDILIRYKRMQGYNALWQPGTDHASIATEVKIIEKLKEEGISKEDLGREGFLKRAWEWKAEYGGRIIEQLKKLGSSCDWDRERFTMDEGCNKAVTEVFCKMHEKGWIYKGSRIINWCPVCNTSISDAEVEYEEQAGHFWHIKYPLIEDDGTVSTTRFLEFATTRPETMLGDTAVAVHPDDDRYKDIVGKKLMLPIINREIPIIADAYVDREFGTGVVKITPAHDPNDFEVGKRHNLPEINILNDDATINENGGKFCGMDRYAAREAIVKELDEMGLLVRIEDYTHNVGTHDRCKTTIEPMIKKQWFVRMDELIKPAVKAVKDGDIQLIPKRMEKTYFNWTDNIRDWCISRQLWWGHRIPAYYCDDCGEVVVAREMPGVCPKCGCTHFTQDEDVLDTWFSSALWPFSTLGWPEKTPELDYFYPNSVMVTGYDILFFWVIRMVFSSCETMGEIPFKHVFLHGLVRDEQGRKMSKSLGNGIDPLEVIDEVGADALRFMLCTGISPGNDMRFIRGKLENARNFANKLWNASRFTMMNLVDENGSFLEMADADSAVLRDEDKWIISRVNDAAKDITESLEKFELGLAGQKVYDLIWDEFCDWYIELVKRRLWSDDEEDKKTARYVLVKVLRDQLKLLHPFMPFITEEIWGALPEVAATEDNPSSLLIRSEWPVYDEAMDYADAVFRINTAMDVIKAVRNIRAEADAAPSRKLNLIVRTDSHKDVIAQIEEYVQAIANVVSITVTDSEGAAPDDVMSAVIDGAEILVPLDELVDIAAEIERLEKEKKKLEGEVTRVEKKLANQGFVAKAPAAVVEEEKAKGEKYREMLETVTARLESLKSR